MFKPSISSLIWSVSLLALVSCNKFVVTNPPTVESNIKITKVEASSSGLKLRGDTIEVEVNFTDPVTVSGSPILNVMTSNGMRYFNYMSGSGTNKLTFSYTLVSGDQSLSGPTATFPINLNGGTIIKVGSSDTANLNYIATSLNSLIIDAMPVEISQIDYPVNGTYGLNQTIDIVLHLTHPVTVSGVPTIPISVGGVTRYADYISDPDPSVLTFQYTVVAHEADTNGIELQFPIVHSGSSITTSLNRVLNLLSISIPLPNVLVESRDFSNSTITGLGPVTANGVATSTVTITLLDASSQPVAGKTPTFSATDTGSSNVYGSCSVSNVSGVSTCTLASTTPETKTLSLVTPVAQAGGSVVFAAGSADATNSTISGTSGITANGAATSTVTITLLDALSNPLAGVVPTFSATDTGSVNSYNTCSSSNASGVSTCTMTSTKAETKTLQLVTPVAKAGGSVVFIAGAATSGNSTISGTGPVLANGTATSAITITLRDAYNNLVSSVTPTFSATDTSGGNAYGACSASDSSGISSCTMTSSHSETKTLSIATPVVKAGGSVDFWSFPATPTIAITSSTTNSSVNTNQAVLNLSITADTGAVKWCVKESLNSDSDPTTPLSTDPCFVSTRPTTHTLTGRGVRRITVWTQNSWNNLSATPGTDTIDFPLPSGLAPLAGPSKLPQSGCSDVITVTQIDSYGLPSTSAAGSPTTVTLSGAGGGSFYSDAGCTVPTSSLTLSTGESSKSYYFKSNVLGTLTLAASAFSGTQTLVRTVVIVNLISTSMTGTTCAIVAGNVQCWGDNIYASKTGNNSFSTEPAAIQVPGITSDATSISIKNDHGCVVVDGSIKCWGANYTYQIGTGDTTDSNIPFAVPGTSGARVVDTGFFHTCAVIGESAYCWGNNGTGAVGDGTSISRGAPTLVTGLSSGVTDIGAGYNFSCAVSNGALKCWGDNWTGQLGNNSTTRSLVPVQVQGMSSGVTKVGISAYNACAIKDGEVYCWGPNWYNQLATDSSTSSSIVPLKINGLPANIDNIAVGYYYVCASTITETYCWGSNRSGQLGAGTITSYPNVEVAQLNPITGVLSMSAGTDTTCANLDGNILKCWGGNQTNQFGNASNNSIGVPAPTLGLGTTASSLSVGSRSSCAVLSDGTIKCWGAAYNGVLGNYNDKDTSTPTSVAILNSGVTAVSIGQSANCAIRSGGAYCWGSKDNGQTGSTHPGYEPGQVTGLTSGVTAISTSQKGFHTCAVVNQGVMCWGKAEDGRLGINSGNSKEEAPVAVTSLVPGTAAGATNVSVGTDHTCALVGSKVFCWGRNQYGQIGNGTFASQYAPVEIISAGATSVSAGETHTCAAINGGVSCWGESPWNMGAGYIGNSWVPTSIIAGGSGVTKVSVGRENSCALFSSGEVKCWGRGINGRLGQSSYISSMTPLTVVSLSSGASEIGVGDEHVCALVSGVVKCWGSNSSGALGDGALQSQITEESPILLGSPSTLTLTGPASTTAGSCSTAFTVTLTTSAGAVINAPSAYTLALSNGGTGLFYDSAGCGGAAVTSITMSSGSSTATFYYKAATTQEVGIIVSKLKLIRSSIKHVVN